MKVRDLCEIWVLQAIATVYIYLRARNINSNGFLGNYTPDLAHVSLGDQLVQWQGENDAVFTEFGLRGATSRGEARTVEEVVLCEAEWREVDYVDLGVGVDTLSFQARILCIWREVDCVKLGMGVDNLSFQARIICIW